MIFNVNGQEIGNPNVFKQTELPTLLNNSKITSIDGIPITELKAVFNNAGGASGNGLGEKSRETY